MKQIVDRNLAVDRGEHRRPVRGSAAFAPRVLADREFVRELEAALLDLVENVFRGHQFGEAGRKDQLVSVTLVQYGAVFSIDQDGVRSRDIWLVFFLHVLFLNLMRRSGCAFIRRTGCVGRRCDGDSTKAACKKGYHRPTPKGKIWQAHHRASFTTSA